MPLRSPWIAVQFLTRFPLRLEPAPAGREVGLSLLWYPAVGLALGAVLWIALALLAPLPRPLAAALVLALWVACTGALHLDGLADVADAWVGGRGDRERTLAIMKDPHCGPMAVAVVVCVLLLKFAALAALSARPGWTSAHFACGAMLPSLLARAAVPLLFADTPYLRPAGLGAELAQYQSRAGNRAAALLTCAAVIAACGRNGIAALAAAGVIYLLMRWAFLRRLGGLTGDCAGALIEAIEAGSLVTLASV